MEPSADPRTAISLLLDEAPPVLIEVRFLNSATSPDWYLCEDMDQFDEILERPGPGADLHVSSVWDLKNARGEILLKK